MPDKTFKNVFMSLKFEIMLKKKIKKLFKFYIFNNFEIKSELLVYLIKLIILKKMF